MAKSLKDLMDKIEEDPKRFDLEPGAYTRLTGETWPMCERVGHHWQPIHGGLERCQECGKEVRLKT